MFKAGDRVEIKPSAQIDIGYRAWPYVKDHLYGTVKSVQVCEKKTEESICAVEFDEPFAGGIRCLGMCKEFQGQFITSKHLSLNFEESREVNTVPKLEPGWHL